MKVAILIPWFLPNKGGAELGAWELGRRLVSNGHEVFVITPRYRLDWPEREEKDGIHILRYFSLAPSRLKRTSEIIHCLYGLRGVQAYLNEVQPDVLHLHYMFFTGYAGMWWARLHKKPVVLSLVGNDVYDPYYIPCSYLGKLNRWMVRKANSVIAASNFVRQIIENKLGPAKHPIPIIPYGVSLNRFTSSSPDIALKARERLDLPLDRPIVLTVQRLHERKAVHYYLEAAAKILQSIPAAMFIVVGGGPEKERLEQKTRELGIQNNVRFAGRVSDEDLPLYYQACDLFAFHTLHEGFGIVLLEAMASGKAVVTTRAGGTLDIVQTNENGLLVEPKDVTAFAQAVVRLLNDPPLLKSMGTRNRARVENKFNWDHITKDYEAVYKTAQEEIAC